MTNPTDTAEHRSMPHERAVEIARRVLGSYLEYLQPNDAIIRAVQAGYAEALTKAGSATQLQAAQTEEQLRGLLAAAYQIVGVLADRTDLFEHPSVIEALNALSSQEEDPAKPLLPFPTIPFNDTK